MGLFGIATNREIQEIKDKIQAFDSTDHISNDSSQTSSTYTDRALYKEYKCNAMLQTIVNSVADDTTRAGFYVTIQSIGNKPIEGEEGKTIGDAIEQRYNELMYDTTRGASLIREMIKFSRIYDTGSGLFFGIMDSQGNGGIETKATDKVPNTFSKIDYVNVFDDPTYYTVNRSTVQSPIAKYYGIPDIWADGNKIDRSRYVWMFNEFDPATAHGVSVAQAVMTAIDAMDAALTGSKHILNRVGAFKFKSDKTKIGTNTPESIKALMTLIKNTLTNRGGIGIAPGDELDMLNFSFSGLRDVYDFLIDMLSAMSKIPRSIIIGSMKGGIVTGEGTSGELENYYRTCANFQDVKLRAIDSKIIDLIMREKDKEVFKITEGKPVKFDIVYRSLWELTEAEKLANMKTYAEIDNIDINSGKLAGTEARTMDKRLAGLDTIE